VSTFRTAHYQCQPGSVEKCQQANREFIEYIKANEPGTLRYTSLQQADDPTKFMNFMIFQDEAAEERHRTSEGVRRFTDVLYPELVDGVQFTAYTILAST
jgi:quinol monooxygenase YgiN